jgi:DivIVA domain-containing protein
MLAVEVLVVAAIVFGVVMVLAGRGDRMTEAEPDRPDLGLPDDRPIVAADVRGLRFRRALRGYRMSDVDDALNRLAAALAEHEDLD